MLFFSRSNKLFQWVAPIKSWYRYALTLCVSASFFGIWWCCVYTPLGMVSVSYRQQNQTMRNQCDHDTQECQMLPSLENTVKELQYALDAYTVKVSNNEQELSINDVMSAINTSGLTLSAYNVEREVDKKLYTKSIMRLSLVGGYQQLLHFFEQMHTHKTLIACKNVSLQALEPQKYTINCELASFSWGK